MKEFIEKWKTDSRFKTKVKLGLYTLFVVFVAIFALSGNANLPEENLENEYNENNNTILNDEISIKIPEEYEYKIKVTKNNNDYKFEGRKQNKKVTIIKTTDNIVTNYIYENNNYYKEENQIYILTEKETVYEPVNYNYINLDTINQYLSKSQKEDNKYLVYLKDIILGNDSEEYITITKNTIDNQYQINVDYTPLMKLFDKNIENYLVNINIDELE